MLLKWTMAVLSLLSLTLSFGCDGSNTNARQGGAPTMKLQLNWLPEPQFGGFYAASALGTFESHGLNVEVVKGGPGTPTVQMVAAGTVPFGLASADEVIIARGNGADVVALFAVYQTNPQGLMTHAARGFEEIGEIFTHQGTVAMQRGLPYAAYLEKQFGFDKVKIVPSPGGDLSVFRNDPNYTMQCFVTSEPLAAEKAGLDPQTFLIAEAGYNPYTTVVVTNGEFLKNNRETVEKMIAAVRDGWEAYLENPASTNAAMHKLNPTMNEQTFADSAKAQKRLIVTEETNRLGIGGMTLERWQTLCDQLMDLKVITTAPDPASCFLDVVPATAASAD